MPFKKNVAVLNILRRRSFTKKLGISFVITTLISCSVCLITLLCLDKSVRSSHRVLTDYAQNLILAGKLQAEEEATVAKNRGFLISGDKIYLSRADTARAKFLKNLDQIDRAPSASPEGSLLLSKIRESDDSYQKTFSKFVTLRKSGVDFYQEAKKFEDELDPKRQILEGAVDQYVALTGKRFTGETAALSRTNKKVFFLLVMGASLGLALVVALAVLVTRMLSRLYVQAECLAKARKEIVETVAHDLRNPIAAIKLTTETLLRAAQNNEKLTVNEVRDKIERMRRSTNRMNLLVGSYLDLIRFEHGAINLEKRNCDVSGILDDVIESFEQICLKNQIKLKIEQKVFVNINCDYERVIQIFSNLVGNAIKFSEAGSEVKIGSSKMAGAVAFYVSDQGVGISPEEQRTIFDRYWKSDGNKNSGTGLGLAICKGIVEGHGGAIWVESCPGRGSVFSFSIPFLEDPRKIPVQESQGREKNPPTIIS